jgi:hypothetical protein
MIGCIKMCECGVRKKSDGVLIYYLAAPYFEDTVVSKIALRLSGTESATCGLVSALFRAQWLMRH